MSNERVRDLPLAAANHGRRRSDYWYGDRRIDAKRQYGQELEKSKRPPLALGALFSRTSIMVGSAAAADEQIIVGSRSHEWQKRTVGHDGARFF
jgi:hypothetical protein